MKAAAERAEHQQGRQIIGEAGQVRRLVGRDLDDVDRPCAPAARDDAPTAAPRAGCRPAGPEPPGTTKVATKRPGRLAGAVRPGHAVAADQRRRSSAPPRSPARSPRPSSGRGSGSAARIDRRRSRTSSGLRRRRAGPSARSTGAAGAGGRGARAEPNGPCRDRRAAAASSSRRAGRGAASPPLYRPPSAGLSLPFTEAGGRWPSARWTRAAGAARQPAFQPKETIDASHALLRSPCSRPARRRRPRRRRAPTLRVEPYAFRLADGTDARRRARHLHRARGPQRSRARAGSRSASSASARPIPIPARRSSISPAARAARASPPRAGRASRSSSRLRAGRRRDRARPARRRPLQPYPALHGRAPARSRRRAERGDAHRLLSRDAAGLRRALARRRGRGERLYDRAERRRSRGSAPRARRPPDRSVGRFPTAPISPWRRCAAIPRSIGRVALASAEGMGQTVKLPGPCRRRLRADRRGAGRRPGRADAPGPCPLRRRAADLRVRRARRRARSASAPIPSRCG